ncbi:MAG: DUF6220 domain-containing protein [Cyanobacteria bacterium P01_F01_bin.3]
MTTHCPSEQLSIEAEASKRWLQVSFLAIGILFNLCLVAQLLTVGLAIFSDTSWWRIHIWLVRGYGGLAVLLFVGTLITSFPKRIQALTSAIVILLLLQFVTAHVQQPLPLGVLHPLTGFTLFTTSTTLVHRVMAFVRGHSDSAQNLDIQDLDIQNPDI